jgi:hypothetical protein
MEFKLSAILWDGGQRGMEIKPLTGDVAWRGGDPSEVDIKLRVANRKLTSAWWLAWLLRFWRKLELVLVVQLKRADGQPPGLSWELAQADGRADS